VSLGELQEQVEGRVVVGGAPDAVGLDDAGAQVGDLGEGEAGQVEAVGGAGYEADAEACVDEGEEAVDLSDLLDVAGFDAGAVEAADDEFLEVAGGDGGVVEDVVAADVVEGGQVAELGEGVVAGTGEDEVLGVDEAGGEDFGGGYAAGEADVEVAGEEGVDLVAGDHFGEGEFDGGHVLGDGADPGAEDGECGDGGEADAEGACGAAGGVAGGDGCGGGEVEDAAGFGEEGFACGGEEDGAGGSDEEFDVEGAFEFLYLAGEWGLGDAEAGGGAAEVAFFGDGDEAAELFEGECHAGKVSQDTFLDLDRY
jgi:hypothetical protein